MNHQDLVHSLCQKIEIETKYEQEQDGYKVFLIHYSRKRMIDIITGDVSG